MIGIGIGLGLGCYRDSAPTVSNRGDEPLATAPSGCGKTDDVDVALVDPSPEARMRAHVQGPLSARDRRSWNGPEVPDAIPRKLGTMELFLADYADGGILAMYRDPYGHASCTLGGANNCATEAHLYSEAGVLAWSLPLAAVMSRPDQLEIQDIRLADGVLYFNEACQSYARYAHGECSSLVAVDPIAQRVLWRTPPLVSNGRFRLVGCYLISGYGFTDEDDHLVLVDRATGAVRQRLSVSSAPQVFRTPDRNSLDVSLYSGIVRYFKLEGMTGPAGRIEAIGGDPGFGGATYGGLGYGGVGYGGATYRSQTP